MFLTKAGTATRIIFLSTTRQKSLTNPPKNKNKIKKTAMIKEGRIKKRGSFKFNPYRIK